MKLSDTQAKTLLMLWEDEKRFRHMILELWQKVDKARLEQQIYIDVGD